MQKKKKGKREIMKKLVLLMMCLVLSVVSVGCQNVEEESTEWIDESAAMIGQEITSGQFVLDGVVYEFPMSLQQWLDNGWHISNNYDNVDKFTLAPGGASTEFELFNEEGDYVRVSVVNMSGEEAKVQECMVFSLYMSTTEVDIVLPQGLTQRNKPADVIAAYGEPDSKGDEPRLLEAVYNYETEDAVKCYVELDVIDNDYTINPLASVEYSMLSSADIWEPLVESVGLEMACEYYLDATMKACYWGESTDYVNCGMDTISGATALYDSAMSYYAEFLMYYAGIDVTCVSSEVTSRFVQVAEDVLKNVKWNIKSVEVDVFEEGTVILELYPTNYLDIIDADIENAIQQFSEKYADVDFENMTDEEYMVAEEEYAVSVIDAIEKRVGEISNLEAVEKEYELDIDGAIVSNDAWVEIDDTLMDIEFETEE